MHAVFVEKILRVQPNVKMLYLLVRASDSESATQRFHKEVIEKDIFRVLRNNLGANLESFLFERVTPISGDIRDENFGIKDSILIEEMWKEIDIVLNSAATTNFDERYDVALGINTYGALHVLNFAKKCIKLKVLLHVSTGVLVERGTMAGLEEMWARFSLSEEEERGVDVDGQEVTIPHRLASKFFTKRVLNVDAVAHTFKPLWRPRGELKIRDMGDNILLFEFEDCLDME
nr:isoform 2 of probable fatty acyl-coa reductase 4 [Quercus suber]